MFVFIAGVLACDYLLTRGTPFILFFYMDLVLICCLLVLLVLFRYGGVIWDFLDWISTPRRKPPEFGCARCDSQRVIIHERQQEGFLYRYFWCQDCGYHWSNIEPRSNSSPPPGEKSK